MIKQTISAILALTIFSMAWANGFERQKYNFNSDWKLMVGDIAGAEKLYKNVLIASNKKYQEGALYSLGVMMYNQGATILQKATPIATTEPDKYNAEKAKADAAWKQAKEYLDKALALNPSNANAKKIADAIAASQK